GGASGEGDGPAVAGAGTDTPSVAPVDADGTVHEGVRSMREMAQIVIEQDDEISAYVNWQNEIVVRVNSQSVLYVARSKVRELARALLAAAHEAEAQKKTTAATVA